MYNAHIMKSFQSSWKNTKLDVQMRYLSGNYKMERDKDDILKLTLSKLNISKYIIK